MITSQDHKINFSSVGAIPCGRPCRYENDLHAQRFGNVIDTHDMEGMAHARPCVSTFFWTTTRVCPTLTFNLPPSTINLPQPLLNLLHHRHRHAFRQS